MAAKNINTEVTADPINSLFHESNDHKMASTKRFGLGAKARKKQLAAARAKAKQAPANSEISEEDHAHPSLHKPTGNDFKQTVPGGRSAIKIESMAHAADSQHGNYFKNQKYVRYINALRYFWAIKLPKYIERFCT